MADTYHLKIGTRGSPLARTQAEWTAKQLRERGHEVELVFITTQGDVKTGALGQIGGQGLFTKEIQRALLTREVDIAVHSLKDLPTEPVDELILGAVPERESVNDVFLSHQAKTLAGLPQGSRVGTGSLRRRAQLLHARPDLNVLDIRGNVDTRLRKLDDGDYDAIILASAGLNRLGLTNRIVEMLPCETMLPAVGQGALGIEIREDNENARRALQPLNDAATHAAIIAERAMLAELRGGCLAPVGAWGRLVDRQLTLEGVVLRGDGTERLSAIAETESLEDAYELGVHVARLLLIQGAAKLIADSRTGG